jgi:hypothetical protein
MDFCPVFYPAYYLEHVTYTNVLQAKYGPSPQNWASIAIVPKIIAVVVPIFYAYQALLYGTAYVLDSALSACCISPGTILPNAWMHTQYSIRGAVSSLMEIPEKFCGSNNCPNYCGDRFRYIRKDLSNCG